MAVNSVDAPFFNFISNFFGLRYTNTHLHKQTKMCICYFESRQVHKNVFLCIFVNVFLGLLQCFRTIFPQSCKSFEQESDQENRNIILINCPLQFSTHVKK